jgi:hypothetical protein
MLLKLHLLQFGGGGGIYCKISVSEKSNDFFAKIEAEDAHALFFDES